MYVQFNVSTKIYTIIQRYLDTRVFFDEMYFNLQNYDETYCHDFYLHNHHITYKWIKWISEN